MPAPDLQVNVSIQKVGKHASAKSGDTAEIVERGDGGFSVVLVDGQGSGRGAKALSLLISARAVSLLKDGMRDRAAVEGVHDFLLAHRNGLVSATVDIVTLTPRNHSLVLTRQSSVPAAIDTGNGFEILACESGPIGRWNGRDPWCYAHPAVNGLRLIVTTDGVAGAGARGTGHPLNIAELANHMSPEMVTANEIAEYVLNEAIRRENDRPADDLTVVALTVAPAPKEPGRRMMALSVPL